MNRNQKNIYTAGDDIAIADCIMRYIENIRGGKKIQPGEYLKNFTFDSTEAETEYRSFLSVALWLENGARSTDKLLENCVTKRNLQESKDRLYQTIKEKLDKLR